MNGKSFAMLSPELREFYESYENLVAIDVYRFAGFILASSSNRELTVQCLYGILDHIKEQQDLILKLKTELDSLKELNKAFFHPLKLNT